MVGLGKSPLIFLGMMTLNNYATHDPVHLKQFGQGNRALYRPFILLGNSMSSLWFPFLFLLCLILDLKLFVARRAFSKYLSIYVS